MGEIIWADVEGRAGIRFVKISPESNTRLKGWLAEKQREEGWNVAQA
jgi:hypothetical protein